MDGEVALAAALVISANHHIARPDDPMHWFAGQRAFSRCGEISFHAATKAPDGRIASVALADSPETWLEQLGNSHVERVVLRCERQDEELETDDDLPDRIAAGFAGGGSLWAFTTETGNGKAMDWRAQWRAAFPDAPDGRIWAVRLTATGGEPQDLGRTVDAAATELRHALNAMLDHAERHDVDAAHRRLGAALTLLSGDPDPMPIPRPPGPGDTLSEPARRLLHAAQRGWIFADADMWGKVRQGEADWRRFAQAQEALYDAVTSALVAAVNSSVPNAP